MKYNLFKESIFGVVNRKGEHIDVSRSLLGAKNYATRHGYTVVSRRGMGSYHIQEMAYKANGKWHEWDSTGAEILESNILRAYENRSKIYGVQA